MTLIEQLLAIVYHFIMGEVFALLFSFFSLCTLSFRMWGRICWYVSFTLFFTAITYYFLYRMNGGRTHIYFYLLFLVGLIMYYRFFYTSLIPLFLGIKKLFLPVKKKISWVKHQCCVIIKKQGDKIRRFISKYGQPKKGESKENE